MRRIALPAAALALLLTGSLAFAQQPATPDSSPQQTAPAGQFHGHRHNPERETKMLAKRLNLTPDQTAKLEPILADRDQKLKALRTNTALSEQEKHQQMRTIQQDTKQQLDAVLTPDQIQQMKAMRHHRGGPNQEQPAPAPGL